MAAGTVDSTGNPYKMTGVVDTDTTITDESVAIQGILWENVTASGHLLAVKDKGGRTILALAADGAANYYVSFPKGLPVNGIHSDDMDSGTLFVYLK